MMTRKVRQIPRYGRIRAPEYRGAINQGYIIEFGASYPLRLHDPEQARVMQIALRFRRQAPQFFRARRTLAKSWQECLGALNHSRESLVVRIRPCGLACAWLSTNTRHVAFLAISPVPRS